MKKIILVLFINVFCFQAFAQTFTGTIDLTDPVYNRPDPGTPPTVFSSAGINVHYDVISFTVATPGMITFTSSSGFDNYGVLYSSAGFDPLNPLTNALVANDDMAGTTNFGFVYNFTVPGTYYLVVSPFTKSTTMGPYTVTLIPAAVLPVYLVSFTAEKAGGSNNVIKWSNENEVNVDKYQLQLSTDGKVFYDVPSAIIMARNVSSASYSYVITNPAEGVNFYRLRITEKSGSITLSPVAAVNNKKIGAAFVKVFPNPATDYLFIETKSNQSGKANISVINASGAIVYTRSYELSSQSILTVDVRSLSTGKYFIKTTINKEEKMVQFIKK